MNKYMTIIHFFQHKTYALAELLLKEHLKRLSSLTMNELKKIRKNIYYDGGSTSSDGGRGKTKNVDWGGGQSLMGGGVGLDEGGGPTPQLLITLLHQPHSF